MFGGRKLMDRYMICFGEKKSKDLLIDNMGVVVRVFQFKILLLSIKRFFTNVLFLN